VFDSSLVGFEKEKIVLHNSMFAQIYDFLAKKVAKNTQKKL